jgi:hypothetical protein
MSDVTDAIPTPETSNDPSPDEGNYTAPSPWSSWEQAGWDPSSSNPYQVREALNFYSALQDRNQRDFYLERTLAGHELPEGMSLSEAKEAIAAAHKAKMDPWSRLEESGIGMDEDIGLQALDQSQLDQVIQARIDSALQAERDRQSQERFQQQLEAEFSREFERVKSTNNLTDDEAGFIAAHASTLYQQNPNMPMSTYFDQAHSAYMTNQERRFAEWAKQQGQAPATTSPGSSAAPASDQQPQNMDDVKKIMESRFNQ